MTDVEKNRWTITPEDKEKVKVLSEDAEQYFLCSRHIIDLYIPENIKPESETDVLKQDLVRTLLSKTILARLMMFPKEQREQYANNPDGPIEAMHKVTDISEISQEEKDIINSNLNDISDLDVKNVLPFYEKIDMISRDGNGNKMLNEFGKVISFDNHAEDAYIYTLFNGA